MYFKHVEIFSKKKSINKGVLKSIFLKIYFPNLSEHRGLNKIQLGEKATDIIKSHSVSFAKNFGFML